MKITKALSVGLFFAASQVDAGAAGAAASKCRDVKAIYKEASCCGNPEESSNYQVVPVPGKGILHEVANPCAGTKPASGYDNSACKDGASVAANINEQSGTDVSVGYKGTKATDAEPITDHYYQAGLCPVNVHWHLGSEHRSEGEYDENGKGPTIPHGRRLANGTTLRRLAGESPPVLHGLRCHHYRANQEMFTKPYAWKHCVNMTVGETYEVHWPHSTQGACGTVHQYQTPFYDGVFCNFNGKGVAKALTSTQADIGVHGQVFVIVNDESYYYPDLIKGMIRGVGDYGKHITNYTGSTTGTSRTNSVCSAYSPITWQVDRTCHLISASSFDKMCADMKLQHDDMSNDLHPHGSRELVLQELAADNHGSNRRLFESIYANFLDEDFLRKK